MKKSKQRYRILLALLLAIALVLQTPLYALAEPAQEEGSEALPTEVPVGNEEDATLEGTAPEEAPPLDEQEAASSETVEEPAGDPLEETESAVEEVEEATEGEESEGFETLAVPNLNGALVTIASALDKSKYLDIPRQSTASGTPVTLWSEGQTPNQRFRLVQDSDGYYSIVNIKSNLVFDITRSNLSNGTEVIQYASTGGKNQKWKLIANSDGSYTFASRLDESVCLDLSSSRAAKGSSLIVYRRDNGRSTQRFAITVLSPFVQNGVYAIRSSASGKVLDISSSSFDNSASVISYQIHDGLNQRFVFTYNSQTGYYTIRSVNSNKMFDVPGSRMEQDIPIIQYTETGNFNQQWSIVKASNDSYYIFAAHSGMTLDLPRGSSANSTPVTTWSFHGGTNQQWKFDQRALVNEGLSTVQSAVGLRIDIQGSSEGNSADALVYSITSGLNQKFFVRKIGGSTSKTYILECVHSGKLLSVDSATGTKVYQYAGQGNGSGNSYQQWALEPAGSASFRFKNVATGKYLDCGNGTSSTRLKVASFGSFSSQAWKLQATDPLADGLYVFASALDNSLVFDIPGQSTEEGIALALWTPNGGPHQTFETTKLGTDRYSITSLNSGMALNVEGGRIDSRTGAGKVVQQNKQSGNANQIWKIEYAGGGCFRFVSTLQNGRACMTLGSNSPTIRTQVVLLDINNAATQAFKPIPVGAISYYQMNYTLDQFASWQIGGSTAAIKSYVDPANKTGYSFMQFADVRVGTGVTGAQLNSFIDSTANGRNGIFHNRGQAFVNAANKYGINEVYFLAHAILESAWGTSNFALGNYYDGRKLSDGKTYPAGTYYNFWGIGAYDSNPNYAIEYAVTHGWSSPENAIDGSARWISENYIYGTYPQPTVYAMRWDYVRSNFEGQRGWHQYATSFTWPNSIPRIMNDCYNYVGVSPKLYYVVPQFK